ncbi:hypothetical protein [Paenisporosarcina sp. NPDC076898]|uniref:hypothetical protein n=1 Tax=unclassified Paenisporosarcina TaxID=2642018 RepID=UPI003CFF41E6
MKISKSKSLLPASVLVSSFLFLWLSGLLGTWTTGMPFIVGDTNRYHVEKSHTVKGTYSLTVDLTNLESNVGKDLYNDGTHRIYVTHIRTSDHDGVYEIIFRSSGTYSQSGASLISGIHHAVINENAFTSEMSAKVSTEIDGKSYEYYPSATATSGINFRDGDEFGFYIGPKDVSENEANILDKEESLKITVTNLYLNSWRKNK